MKTITITLEDAKEWLRAVDETEHIKMSFFMWNDFLQVVGRLRELVAQEERKDDND